jgi:hypothetical protein
MTKLKGHIPLTKLHDKTKAEEFYRYHLGPKSIEFNQKRDFPSCSWLNQNPLEEESGFPWRQRTYFCPWRASAMRCTGNEFCQKKKKRLHEFGREI